MSTPTQKEEIVSVAEMYGDAINGGRREEADSACNQLEEMLRAMDQTTRMRVLPDLCQHPSCSVRLWAATYLSAHNPELAERTLIDLTQKKSLISLVAEMNLDRHRNGQLET